jgi:dienelactone hydrolase
VLELAGAKVPFKAVAAIHPALPAADTEVWTSVGGAFLLCTGSEDPLCTPAQLMEFGNALQNAGVDWRVNIYGGAQHAFWADPNESGGSPTDATVPGVAHHALHSARAWQAVLDLLAEAFPTAGSERS